VRAALAIFDHWLTKGEWNWPEGKRAFKDNREAFATHLVSQVMTRDLDGVDIDIEGVIDSTEDDRQSYLAFVQTLSGKLRPLGKTLTLDSFHSKWNAPNGTGGPSSWHRHLGCQPARARMAQARGMGSTQSDQIEVMPTPVGLRPPTPPKRVLGRSGLRARGRGSR
jgi:hypothetical protein